jgi:hypothetical protein
MPLGIRRASINRYFSNYIWVKTVLKFRGRKNDDNIDGRRGGEDTAEQEKNRKKTRTEDG